MICRRSAVDQVESLSHARLFATPWIVACIKLLRPWDFQGKSTGVGCHFLLQGIFPTQGSNLGLSHCRQMLYHLSHEGSPAVDYIRVNNQPRDYPGGPVIKNPPSNAGDAGSILGQRTMIPHATGQLTLHATAKELAPQLRPNAAKYIS